jgi:hypothetical protein
MLATMGWVMEGNRPAFAAVAVAMGADDPLAAYERLVRASGIHVDAAGDGLAAVTPEELARWLTDTNASAFGGEGASYEGWLRVARGGFAPSAVIADGKMQSGVEAL